MPHNFFDTPQMLSSTPQPHCFGFDGSSNPVLQEDYPSIEVELGTHNRGVTGAVPLCTHFPTLHNSLQFCYLGV